MNRIAAIGLFCCLTIPILFTSWWIHHQKYMLKKQVKHHLLSSVDVDELVHLSFAKKDIDQLLRWEHSKEFEYQEQMYDVVQKQETIDSIHYWCWWDHEETQLNKQLKNLLHQALVGNPFEIENRTELINFYNKLFYAETNPFLASLKSVTNSIAYTHQISGNSHLDFWAPPPDIFSFQVF